jgi:hypothetical protein
MLARFYNWSVSDIKKLTIKEFNFALEYIGKISKIENGVDKPDQSSKVGNADDLSRRLKDKK